MLKKPDNNVMWVIVNRTTKSICFLPIQNAFSLDTLALFYVKEITRMHGVPIAIVLN